MSTHIIEGRSKYEIRDARLPDAEAWLEANANGPHASAAYRQGTSIVYPAEDVLFGGSVAYGWDEQVIEFMLKFCEVGSYAVFQDDEWNEWYMAELTRDQVAWHSPTCASPFDARCDALEKPVGHTDLAEFVLGPLTACVRAAAHDVKALHYEEDLVLDDGFGPSRHYEQVVVVEFQNGYRKYANVHLDSPFGAMKDVIRAIEH